MKVPSLLAILCSLGLLLAAGAARAGTNSPPRLTVELRDGSRVVGASTESQLGFHSDLLGNLKLEVKDIRSVECLSSNSAKLTTISGDTLTVSFAASSILVKTGFGKVDLAVDTIRKFTVWSGASGTASHPHPPGLVALWSAEGDARDSVGNDHGVVQGKLDYVPGQVGQAFGFQDPDGYVKIPASPALDVGAGNGFTLTAWINPSDVSAKEPLFEWTRGDGSYWGVHFYVDGVSFHAGAGTLYANIVDANNGPWHQIHSLPGAVSTGSFQQVALTYDKASGLAQIYCNSVLVAEQFVGQFTPKTTDDLYLGHRPLTENELYTFSGAMDEVAVYNRALSAAEIQNQCREENNGELPPPPAVPALPRFHTRYPGAFNE